jgi:hypothetical protein
MNRDPVLWAAGGGAILAALFSLWAGASMIFAVPFAVIAALSALVALLVTLSRSGVDAGPAAIPRMSPAFLPLRDAMRGDRPGVFDALHSLERSAGFGMRPGDREEESLLLRVPQGEFLRHVKERIERLEGAT